MGPGPRPAQIALTSAMGEAGLAVAEDAPKLVKKPIVGAGHGDKAQIRMMIGVLLPKADPQSEDAADALAIAVTHAHHRDAALLRARYEPLGNGRRRAANPIGSPWRREVSHDRQADRHDRQVR